MNKKQFFSKKIYKHNYKIILTDILLQLLMQITKHLKINILTYIYG